MCDSGGTLVKAADVLLENGADRVYAVSSLLCAYEQQQLGLQSFERLFVLCSASIFSGRQKGCDTRHFQ